MCLGEGKMLVLFTTYVAYDGSKRGVALVQIGDLLIEMAMNGPLHGSGADHQTRAAESRGDPPQSCATDRPDRERAAGLGFAGRHRISKCVSMPPLMLKGIIDPVDEFRVPRSRLELGSVDGDSPMLTSVVDAQDAANKTSLPRVRHRD